MIVLCLGLLTPHTITEKDVYLSTCVNTGGLFSIILAGNWLTHLLKSLTKKRKKKNCSGPRWDLFFRNEWIIEALHVLVNQVATFILFWQSGPIQQLIKAVEVFSIYEAQFLQGLSFSFLSYSLYAILSLTKKNLKRLRPSGLPLFCASSKKQQKKGKKKLHYLFLGWLLCNAITALNIIVYPPEGHRVLAWPITPPPSTDQKRQQVCKKWDISCLML